MATKLLETDTDSRISGSTRNFPMPVTLLCSGLLSATAWVVIAGLVIFLH